MTNIKILPGIGLSSISFGLRKGEVLALLGQPDKSYYTDSGCERLQYADLLIELSIAPDNENKFGWLEVFNPTFTFLGKRLIGKSKQIVLSDVTSALGENPSISDYGSFESYDFEENMVELQFRFERLQSINLGVFISESNEILWPTKNEV